MNVPSMVLSNSGCSQCICFLACFQLSKDQCPSPKRHSTGIVPRESHGSLVYLGLYPQDVPSVDLLRD